MFKKAPRVDMKKKSLITKLEAAIKSFVKPVKEAVSEDKVYGNTADIKVIEAAIKANMPTLLR
ncbi:MAG: hypothetical protein ACTSO7_03760 [Candidatus Heimdallarchaeota archaeon]